MAHLHHHRQHKSPRKTTTHSSMAAERDRFIRSAVVAESLISPEGRTSNSGSDDVASGNPTVCGTRSGCQMSVTV